MLIVYKKKLGGARLDLSYQRLYSGAETRKRPLCFNEVLFQVETFIESAIDRYEQL